MMPTEAMRLDAEEEAARGAVEHLLKTLEKEPAGPEKAPLHLKQEAQSADKEKEKEVQNGTDPPVEQNGMASSDIAAEGNSPPAQNGSDSNSLPAMLEIKQEVDEPHEEQQTEVVSSVVINLLDHMENNVPSADEPDTPSEENGHESLESVPDLGIKHEAENRAGQDSKVEVVSQVILSLIKEEEESEIEEVAPEVVSSVHIELPPEVVTESVEPEKAPESVNADPADRVVEPEVPVVEEEENDKSEIAANIEQLCKKAVESEHQDVEPIVPKEVPVVELGTPEKNASEKPTSEAKAPNKKSKKVLVAPVENVDSVVDSCVSEICDVVDSVDKVVSNVITRQKKKSPKSKSKPEVAEPAKEDTAKETEKKESPKVKKPEEKKKDSPKVEKRKEVPEEKAPVEVREVPVEKKREPKSAKLPAQVPSAPLPEKVPKRKPRKKKQEPIVAPVLPFPTPYFPPPPMMAQPPTLPLNFNFPAPIPVDLSVAKKKVQKVAPIPPLPQLPSSSVADQVLDLSVRRAPRSDKKVKPIKRLSKKALQSVFNPFVNPTDLLQMAAAQNMLPPQMPIPPHLEVRKSKKGAQSVPPPPLPRLTPFAFTIEDHQLGVAPNGTKIFNCDICSGSYQRQFSLKRHYLRSHINPRLITDRDLANCGMSLGPDTPPNLTDLYRCHFCPTAFFRHREDLIKHLAIHPDDSVPHSGSPVMPPAGPPSQVFSCEHCSTTFTSRINLLKHQALHQAQDFPCFYCYKVFSSHTAREKHHFQHTNNDNQHPCMFLCGKTFKTLPELRSHLQIMHNKEYFGCSKCTERFQDSTQLELHNRMAHPGPVHEPPIISITPIIEEAPLPPPPAKQPQISEDAIKYSCSMCSETFPSYVSMCKHRRVAHGTVGKHTKAATSPQKVSREREKETPVSPAKKGPVIVYLESKEDCEMSKPQEEFSLPKLSVGKQTVALTSEVTISALPPEEEDEEEEEPVLIIEKVSEPIPQKPVELPKSAPAPVEEPMPVVERKKPDIKIKLKLNVGKKPLKNKKRNSPKMKPKTVVTVIQKEPPKEVEKPLEEPKEMPKVPDEPVETLKETPEAPKDVPKDPKAPKDTSKVVKEVPKVQKEPSKPSKVTKEALKSNKVIEKTVAQEKVPEIKVISPPEPPPEEIRDYDTPVRHKKLYGRNREKSPQNAEDMAHICLSTQSAIKKRSASSKRKQTVGNKKSRKSSSRPTRNNPNTSEDLASFLQGLELGQAQFQAPPERSTRRGKKLMDEIVVEEILEEGFTGEWIRPRRYICHICRGRFTELWDLDDHVNEVHVNIWCSYSEVDATTSLPEDLFHRSIEPNGVVNVAPVLPLTNPAESDCTKCGKSNGTLPDLHKHMLECGGDTTWMINSPRKRRQWRPFGSRRRSRRGMKRVPSSPMKINRPRKLDGDTIQKMIANLPSKRGSRRVINFNDDEIKTRSQATIHSLRPASANQPASKVRPVLKVQPPKGKTSAAPVAERRSSSDSSKTSERSVRVTAKPPSEESKLKASANGQAPLIVKLKKKKKLKPVEPAPVVEEKPEAPEAVEPEETPKEATKPVEYGPKWDKYAATACPYCDKGLINFFSLIRHLKICPKDPKNIAEKLAGEESKKEMVNPVEVVNACPLCNETFSSSKLLERHASNCCESALEISNRKKVFRRRTSELSVMSRRSDADSEASTVPGSDLDPNKPKRRKRGKGKPFFIRKNTTKKLIYKAKLPTTLQRLVNMQKSEAAAGEADSALKPKIKLKRELANLVMSSPFVPTRVKKIPAQKPSSKKVQQKVAEEVQVESKKLEGQPEELTPVTSAPETTAEAVETVDNLAGVVDNQTASDVVEKPKKKLLKKAKKQFKSPALVETDPDSPAPLAPVPDTKVEVEAKPESKKKKKDKALKIVEAVIEEGVAEVKKAEKKSSKKKSEAKKKKDATKEETVETPAVEDLPKEVSPKKAKKKKDGEAKEKKSPKAKTAVVETEEEDNVPLCQIIKQKKTVKDDQPAEVEMPQAESSEEPKEKLKKKNKKKSQGVDEVKDSSPPKKKQKLESAVVPEAEKRSAENDTLASEESPKKKKGRRSDEHKPHITQCTACNTSYSTAFNYQKHLKTQRHINNARDEEQKAEGEKADEPPLDIEPFISEFDEEDKEVDEIMFPFIKEGTPPLPPPPPPNSPWSPLAEEEPALEISKEVTRFLEQKEDDEKQKAEREKEKVKVTEAEKVETEAKSDDEDDWLQPSKLPPPPKWDFDAVRDSVPNWSSNKSSFKPPTPPPAPSPAPPLIVEEPPEPIEEEKHYDDMYGGIVNQVMSQSDFSPAAADPAALVPTNPYLMGNYEGQQSLEQIQMAMGATDEEMAMLENLGGGTSLAYQAFVYDNSGSYDAAGGQPGCSATLVNLANTTGPIEPLENAELMDLDNQVTEEEQPVEAAREEVFMPTAAAAAKYAAKPNVSLDVVLESSEEGSQVGGAPTNSTKLLSMYEQKEMVCPMCNKHFLGLQALETHIAWAHKVKDTKIVETDVNNAPKSSDQIARERDCLLVGLAAANMLHHAGGMRSGVLRAAAGAVADECAQKKRKIACFVCKELYTDMVALNAHIRKQHVKSKVETANANSGNGLKAKMTSALGGLLDRALTSMLGKVPLPPVEKQHSDGGSKDEIDPRTPLINLDTPLTLTAIAKQAIKPVSDKPPESDESLEAVINKRRKAAAAPKEQPKAEEAEKPPLFPENSFTPSFFDPILPEPQGSDMQCPICLGAVKHFHSLCRHLKTQHTEWAMNTFNTDLFHYLILKRDNPPITINKKYSIYIPVNRSGQQEQSASAATDDSQQQQQSAQPSEPPKKEDDIRIKAFAALQQLSTKKSVRGSKRRPLDISELTQTDREPSNS